MKSFPIGGLWQDSARCKSAFSERDATLDTGRESVAAAEKFVAAYCRAGLGCPVRRECLSEGLRTQAPGVWGGIKLTLHGALPRKLDEAATELVAELLAPSVNGEIPAAQVPNAA